MRRAFVLFAVLAALCGPRTAAAQDAAQEQARVRFRHGIELYDRGDHAAALEEFRAAYLAKPLPTIKRNIALCLRALGRYAEATDALEEMLAEGEATLKPDVKDGARRAIQEMSAHVATARVRVAYGGHTAPPNTVLLVDEREVPLGKPVHASPGEHVFRARAPGFFEAQQRAKLTAAQTADLELTMVAVQVLARGRLAIRTNVETSTVAIDGLGVGTGGWAGELPVGHHRIEVSAVGYAAHAFEIDIAENQPRDVSVDMTSPPGSEVPMPPPYEAPPAPAPRAKHDWYVLGGLSAYGETLTFGEELGDGPQTRRGVNGGGVVAHFGRNLTPVFAVGVLGEIGAMGANSYTNVRDKNTQIKVNLVTWSLAPELRIRSRGKLRALGGVALGFEGQVVNVKTTTPVTGSTTPNDLPQSASGVSGMGLIEVGAQWEPGRVFFEGTIFVDLHGTGGVTGQRVNDAANTGRYFADSPAARAGLRLLVGYTF
jgi:PEGA domain